MIGEYKIEGMTCVACVAKVKKGLESLAGVDIANVQLTAPQASISLSESIPTNDLQKAIGPYKNFEIQKAEYG